MTLIALCVAAVLAGILDASVGSGGAVLLPALIAASPTGTAAVVPLAVNKAVSTAGDLVAAVRHHRDTRTTGHRSPAGLVIITVLCAVGGVLAGVWTASRITADALTWLAAGALLVLAAVLLLRH